MENKIFYCFFLISICNHSILNAQNLNSSLILKMQAYEEDIQNTYSEYQKVYYEQKSSKNELKAFEDIISIYVSQNLEIYETIMLSESKNLEKPRDIAARSLIFRALTYLEKAPLNQEFYEKACYDFYKALDMYSENDIMPVILKQLPKAIKVANKEYHRLIDLLNEKGKELYSFGKVKIILKNFKITSNLDASQFEFVRFNSAEDKKKFSYKDAEALIKNAFKEVLKKNEATSFFIALPEGSYFIRSKSCTNSLLSYLSAIYVRANQQQEYLIEPLLDWIIIYENPKTHQPNFFKAEKNLKGLNVKSKDGNGHSNVVSQINTKDNFKITSAIGDVLNNCMEKVNLSLIFNLRDPWIRSRFSNVSSQVIATFLLNSQYYNCWDQWMLAYNISCSITDKFSPGSTVPSELVQLIYNTIQEF